MKKYLIQRMWQLVIVLFGITTIVFFLQHLTGDPTHLLLPPEATQQDIELFRHEMGFDRPLHIQFSLFLKGVLQGDFGQSLRHNESALKLVFERLPATIELSLAALGIALCLAIPVGVFSALRPNSLMDNVGMIAALLGQSIPIYWSGLMLILLFTVKLNLLSAFGRTDLSSLIMPAVSLGFFSMARITRVTRSSMIGVLKRDYIRTARAKGLVDRKVILRHALKNASLPIITLVGLELGTLLGGAVITETIFAWPGVGRLAIQAIYNRDFPVTRAAVFILALIFVLINLVVDILYTYLDPRVRYD
ncbi:MAG: ABC transporter permease [Deltaproteobacteria bacterium]|nr:ABC transporter permease [Deltaproteobacteria bacterium]